MEKNQELLNAISTISACIDPLIRSGETEAVATVAKKIVELIKLVEFNAKLN